MTSEEWDTHAGRIYMDLRNAGKEPDEAVVIADRETTEQFGPRPGDAP